MQVFISYSRHDLNFANQLVEDLSDYELDIWMDVRSIPHGANWDSEVQKGLDTSDLMLVLLSPASVASQNVGDEWSYFIEKNKPIIPVLVEPCEVPFRLSRRQRVSFSDNYNEGLQELLRAMGSPKLVDPESTQRIRPPQTLRRSVPPPAAPPPSRPVPSVPASPSRQSEPEIGVRMLPIIWANSYHWFNGMKNGTQGDCVISARELALIPKAAPIITIPLKSLITAKVQRSFDQYIKMTYYGPDRAFRTLVMMGAPKDRRNDINHEILNLLKLHTKRSLE